MNDTLDMLLHSDRALPQTNPETVLFVFLLSFTVGHAMGWIYMWTHQSLSYSHTFVTSIVVLPTIVAFMMMLMTGNLVVAFGFLAIMAVVRFRNVLKDTRDATFVLWAIVEGLAIGTSRYSSGLIGVLCIAAILFYLRATSFGSRIRFDAMLSVVLTGNGEDLPIVKDILGRHAVRTQISGTRQRLPDGIGVSYWLQLRDPSRADDLQAELTAATGVTQFALQSRQDESEV